MDTIKLAQRLYAFGKIDKEAYQRILGNQELLEKEGQAFPIAPGLIRVLADIGRKTTVAGPKVIKARAADVLYKLETGLKRKQMAAAAQKIKTDFTQAARNIAETERVRRQLAEPEWRKVITKGLQWALGVGGVGAAAVGAQKVWQFAGIRRSYSNMFNHYPELREYAEPEVKRRFQSLARYAPDVMADPMVAGGYMSHAMRYEKFDPTLIPKIMDIQSGIDRAKLLGRTVPEKALGAMAAKIPFPEL